MLCIYICTHDDVFSDSDRPGMLCFYQGVFEKRKPQENPVVLNNFAWLRSGFESWWGHWTDKIYVSPITPKGRNTTSVEAKLMWSSDLLLHVALFVSWAFCWLSIVVTSCGFKLVIFSSSPWLKASLEMSSFLQGELNEYQNSANTLTTF